MVEPHRPLRFGILGYSPGNGHPFSFSAILNGYDDAALRSAGWHVIADYLGQQDPSDFGETDARVTCCWAPDDAISADLVRACKISEIMTPARMLEAQLDGVIIARDDWECHAELAMPFLEAGIPVFIDKPLTLDETELRAFTPYLKNGLLMSCSALRYARELDMLRADPGKIGRIQLAFGSVPLSMDRYGIHALEALSGVLRTGFTVEHAFRAGDEAHALLRADDGGYCTAIHTFGPSLRRFRMSVFGDKGTVEVDVLDNFSAFRRCLLHFIAQVRTGEPAIPPDETLGLMKTMIEIEARLA